MVGAKSICDRGIMIKDPNLEPLFRPTSIAMKLLRVQKEWLACH
jgi:hypothetical protein